MNEQNFVQKRQQDWARLHELGLRAESSLRKLSDEEITEFISLYRKAGRDLTIARTQTTNPTLIQFLNDLVGGAYTTFHTAKRRSLGDGIRHLLDTATDTARRNKYFLIVSVGLFLGAGIFSFWLMITTPSTRTALEPGMMGDLFKQWKKGTFPERGLGQSATMWSLYSSHNPEVALLAAASAAASFGLITVMQLIQNGFILGALSYEMQTVGKLGFLFASILPHGVPELSGLVFSGAAGLRMGYALINPGRFSRWRALGMAGQDAITLTCTAIALMFIAAPIEGFFSFNPVFSSPIKVAVTIVEIIAWAAFWKFYGRAPSTGDQVSQ
ncbi:MAG: stage II sporulation protein M [Armatimonadetes bacterium]|nr:stage II sporulation protein M [Armatimonadota bacterium]